MDRPNTTLPRPQATSVRPVSHLGDTVGAYERLQPIWAVPMSAGAGAKQPRRRKQSGSRYERQECQSALCGNTAKQGSGYCTPCQSHQEHDRLREQVYSGERVSRKNWESIVDEDVADAAWEAYKWSLRGGETVEQAVAAADRAADSVLKLHRKARRLGLPEEVRQNALDLLGGGHTARRAGQQAAATMIREAAGWSKTEDGSQKGDRDAPERNRPA